LVVKARYSLIVLKVPMNPNHPTNQPANQSVLPWLRMIAIFFNSCSLCN